ncbi:hypothetical protein [Bradyrhizobium sp.]|uniref:hypothetical protein n=1 Tax=Bradyrhizobium sp. TaxID=376 RepID=UPI003BB184D7
MASSLSLGRRLCFCVAAGKAMTEHEIAQKAFSANRERLKAERLMREAAGTPVSAKKAKTKNAKLAPR